MGDRMKAMYSVPISITEARNFMTLEISDKARIPHGSRCLWVAGVRFVTDQPGAYLVAGVGGMQGILVYPPAVENVEEKSA
jgi:hypothetical protein